MAGGGGQTTDNVRLQDLSQDFPQNNNEKARLVERDLDADAARLRLQILVVCWSSVISLFILGTVSIVLAFTEDSTAAFAFALAAYLDCLSSCVVIWRYSESATELYQSSRERLACIMLGVFFHLSAITIIIYAIVCLVNEDSPSQSDALWIVAIVNFCVCVLLCTAKSYLAYRLRSISLATDAVNSAIGATLAFGTLVSTEIYKHNEDIWYVDPTVGIICSIFLVAYGTWVIVFEVKYNRPEKSNKLPASASYQETSVH